MKLIIKKMRTIIKLIGKIKESKSSKYSSAQCIKKSNVSRASVGFEIDKINLYDSKRRASILFRSPP